MKKKKKKKKKKKMTKKKMKEKEKEKEKEEEVKEMFLICSTTKLFKKLLLFLQIRVSPTMFGTIKFGCFCRGEGSVLVLVTTPFFTHFPMLDANFRNFCYNVFPHNFPND